MKRLLFTLSLFVVICLAPHSVAVYAEEFTTEQAVEIINRVEAGDKEAQKHLIPLAESGNTKAQRLLGYFYKTGEGIVRKDIKKALFWYEKSANQGDPSAQTELGVIYFSGRIVRQNYKTAKQWFDKAAAQDFPYSQLFLGLMYEGGWGVKQNKRIAKEWYGKACDGGVQDGCEAYRKLN